MKAYLWYSGGIEAENPLVAAGIHSRTMPASLCTHAGVQHTVWVVFAVGQLCTYKHLHTHTNAHWVHHQAQRISLPLSRSPVVLQREFILSDYINILVTVPFL